ncbi:general secretion pathway protein L [Pseudomonas putida S11]|nr:general secretion pathway protein L [Pseudomonas putida S11]
MCNAIGQGEPPANLQARVALILPAEACSYFRVPAPPGLKREEWPLLLEDRLLQAVDEVTCACLAREPGHLRLLVVGPSATGRLARAVRRSGACRWHVAGQNYSCCRRPRRDMPGNGSAHPA